MLLSPLKLTETLDVESLYISTTKTLTSPYPTPSTRRPVSTLGLNHFLIPNSRVSLYSDPREEMTPTQKRSNFHDHRLDDDTVTVSLTTNGDTRGGVPLCIGNCNPYGSTPTQPNTSQDSIVGTDHYSPRNPERPFSRTRREEGHRRHTTSNVVSLSRKTGKGSPSLSVGKNTGVSRVKSTGVRVLPYINNL